MDKAEGVLSKLATINWLRNFKDEEIVLSLFKITKILFNLLPQIYEVLLKFVSYTKRNLASFPLAAEQ